MNPSGGDNNNNDDVDDDSNGDNSANGSNNNEDVVPAASASSVAAEEVAPDIVVEQQSMEEAETSARKKRVRLELEAGASGVKAKFDAPDVATPCSVCGKQFASWKALFGHMRSHPDRQWRGVHPPPRFSRDVSPEKAAADAAAGALLRAAMQAKNRIEVGGEVAEGSRRAFGFDLNDPPHIQSSGSSDGKSDGGGFDLNKPAEDSSGSDGKKET